MVSFRSVSLNESLIVLVKYAQVCQFDLLQIQADIIEVKHDVNSRRQAAKISLSSFLLIRK